jgi:hypothetical protein
VVIPLRRISFTRSNSDKSTFSDSGTGRSSTTIAGCCSDTTAFAAAGAEDDFPSFAPPSLTPDFNNFVFAIFFAAASSIFLIISADTLLLLG